jgi:hypothetical protein
MTNICTHLNARHREKRTLPLAAITLPVAAIILSVVFLAGIGRADPGATLGNSSQVVDAGTMKGKLLMGYQGWFGCPADGSGNYRWSHWFRRRQPTADDISVDALPDVSELGTDELFPTEMTYSNGRPVSLYSAYNKKTVARHFKWMQDNGLDGVFLQRFTVELSRPSQFTFRNQVTLNVEHGAEAYGRVFAMMYDISGQSEDTVVSTLTNDWTYLVHTLHITDSTRYLRENGKPVVAIWGFGFADRHGTPQDAQAVIRFFKNAGCTVMGGVPTGWRTLTGDSQTDPEWAAVYRAFDIISPWTVGRYHDAEGADRFKRIYLQPDLADAKAHGRDYLPVIWPGYSFYNTGDRPLNQIPRAGGTFYWRQAYNAISAGSTMLYGAMFDEMNEGTAMFKLAPTSRELPAQGTFVPLDMDGYALPSDWYLRLAGQATKMLRGEIPLSAQIPIKPERMMAAAQSDDGQK